MLERSPVSQCYRCFVCVYLGVRFVVGLHSRFRKRGEQVRAKVFLAAPTPLRCVQQIATWRLIQRRTPSRNLSDKWRLAAILL